MKQINLYIFSRSILNIIQKIHPLEIIIALIIIGFIDYTYFPINPGFNFNLFNPYFFLVIFFSVFYGKLPGFFTLGLSIMLLVIMNIYQKSQEGFFAIFPDISSAFIGILRSGQGDKIKAFYQNFSFACLLAVFIFGEIRDSLGRNIQALKKELQILQKNNDKLIYELKTLTLINNEYQGRIFGQENSLISLHSTIEELSATDPDEIFNKILEAVVRFTDATQCSFWKYNIEENHLEALAVHGWDNVAIKEIEKIPDKKTLLGWVARNNEMFSINMLQKYKNLRILDNKKNIITVPINIQEKVWGVLNIEAMPFLKYNSYSENLVKMLVNMSVPIIQNALFFKEITSKGEMDENSGLFSHGKLFAVLNQKFEMSQRQKSPLSLVILEIINYEDLLKQFEKVKIQPLLKEILFLVRLISYTAMVFEYKQDNQIAIVLSNMDYDGTTIFCHNLKDQIDKTEFKIKDELVLIEFNFGFSSLTNTHRSSADLIDLADNLLAIQKSLQKGDIGGF